mgnify:CR=1 FL=1
MSVIFETEGVEIPSILDEQKIIEWIDKVATSHNKEVGDLTYIFCSDEKVLEINNQYLQHDYYTDIITFDYSEDNIISGDIFISLDTVKSNSEQFKTEYKEELHRVIIHGILHLSGFSDHTEEEEKQMRNLENQALKLIL